MKPLKIAICLSGEPRTWEKCADSIVKFFSSEIHTFTFFGHAWLDSTFYKENQPIVAHDKTELAEKMQAIIPFKKLVLSEKTILDFSDNEYIPGLQPIEFSKMMNANSKKPQNYAHMSYSIMMANELKQQYEFENDMRFDLVVRARHDLCYEPESKFEDFLTEEPLPTALYCENYYFPNECYLPQISDIFYWGNSRIMDVVDGFYKYYGSGKFHNMLGEYWNDCVYKASGYNVNLYKWVTLKNILIRNTLIRFCTVRRKKADELDWLTEFDKIKDCDKNLFL